MPYIWTDPDVVLSHRGVDIYYIYPDDLADNPPSQHWFGFDPACGDELDAGSFDLRDLVPLLPAAVRATGNDDAPARLRALIEAGVLTADGVVIAGVVYTDAASIGAAARAAAVGEEGTPCSPSP